MNKKLAIFLWALVFSFMVCTDLTPAKEEKCPFEGGVIYEAIYGRPSLEGPNLTIEKSDGSRKTLVMSGNTLFYPPRLDLKKSGPVYVKFIYDAGMAQALEIIDGRHATSHTAWCPVKKKYMMIIKKIKPN